MLCEALKRTGPELVLVFVQGSGAKKAELLAHRYAGRTPLPQVLVASQI